MSDGKKVCPTPYERKPEKIVAPYASSAVTSNSLPAPLPISAMAGVTSPTMMSGIKNPRNSLNSALNVTNTRTGMSGETMPRQMPRIMATMILGSRPNFNFFIAHNYLHKAECATNLTKRTESHKFAYQDKLHLYVAHPYFSIILPNFAVYSPPPLYYI